MAGREEKRYQAAYDAVSGEGQYKERLDATNFDKFLDALKKSLAMIKHNLITCESRSWLH
jgi:hypothetical protein